MSGLADSGPAAQQPGPKPAPARTISLVKDPNDRSQATKLVIELARYPVQIKFLAIREVDYLAELDDLEERHPGRRLLDNVDAKFFDGTDCPPLTEISDLQFAEAMADEIDTWVRDATAKGIMSA